MNRYRKVLSGLVIAITVASSAQGAELDQWVEKLNAHCAITPQSSSGQEIPSMVLELKEHIFEAAELRAKAITQHKDATDGEKRCAETVLGALPLLKADVERASGSRSSEVTPTSDGSRRGVSADGKWEELERLEKERRDVTAHKEDGSQPQTIAAPVALQPTPAKSNTDAVNTESSSLERLHSTEWLQLMQRNWELLLALYTVALGAVIWRDRKGFDRPWKAVASKATLYTLALPLMVASLVLKLLWYGWKRNLLGENAPSSSPTTANNSLSPQLSQPSTPVDETVNIEIQDAGGGPWKKITRAPNNPDAIRTAFRNLGQSPSIKKVRAVGTRTGQLYDMK